ncbi:hypothetical protein, partial [Kocuria sp. SM24M-10]|uniref:hypothetical protein n=1 Tax=Kocuria sp. SM24M-10 TaxID=1660349 RepID=UPI0006493684
MPNASSKRRSASTGSAAPPEIAARSAGKDAVRSQHGHVVPRALHHPGQRIRRRELLPGAGAELEHGDLEPEVGQRGPGGLRHRLPHHHGGDLGVAEVVGQLPGGG